MSTISCSTPEAEQQNRENLKPSSLHSHLIMNPVLGFVKVRQMGVSVCAAERVTQGDHSALMNVSHALNVGAGNYIHQNEMV